MRLVHAKGFALACALALVSFALVEPPLATQLLVLALPVAVFGIPHGALDLEVARASWPRVRRYLELAFVGFYLTLGALVLALWWLSPGIALAAFLVYSCVHFADDWRRALPGAGYLAGGALAVTAPILFRTDEVDAVFALLAPEDAASRIAAIGAALGAVALVASAVAVVRRRAGGAALELGTLVVAAWGLPPLLYFTLYFCLLHSPRHFLRTARGLARSPAQAARLALVPSAMTIAGALAIGLIALGRGAAFDRTVIGVVFIGLSALTVPHMILVDRFRTAAPWPRSSSPPRPTSSVP